MRNSYPFKCRKRQWGKKSQPTQPHRPTFKFADTSTRRQPTTSTDFQICRHLQPMSSRPNPTNDQLSNLPILPANVSLPEPTAKNHWNTRRPVSPLGLLLRLFLWGMIRFGVRALPYSLAGAWLIYRATKGYSNGLLSIVPSGFHSLSGGCFLRSLFPLFRISTPPAKNGSTEYGPTATNKKCKNLLQQLRYPVPARAVR